MRWRRRSVGQFLGDGPPMMLVAAWLPMLVEASLPLPPGTTTLPQSSPGSLLLMMNGHVPLARAYDGQPWEVAHTEAGIVLDCAGACSVSVPAGESYHLEQHAAPAIAADGVTSRECR